jgi:hypothetical protein
MSKIEELKEAKKKNHQLKRIQNIKNQKESMRDTC